MSRNVKREKIGKIIGYVVDIALAAAVFYAAVYLLRKGSIHYRPESQWPLGILTGLPLVLRPRKSDRARAADTRCTGAALRIVVRPAADRVCGQGRYPDRQRTDLAGLCLPCGDFRHRLLDRLQYTAHGVHRHGHHDGICADRPLCDRVPRHAGPAERFVRRRHGQKCSGELLGAGRAFGPQTVAIAALFCAAVWRVRRPASAPRRWQFAACSLLMGCWLYGLGLAGNSFGFWQGNLEYSEWYYFCRTAENAVVKKPAGYSETVLEQAAQAYAGRSGAVQPNIIMIMNESFADLKSIGDFETNEDYMPFIHSLAEAENTISGDLLVSTFGGGTATTEFEVLTGDTMAFLPFGCSPYQMYVKSETPGAGIRPRDAGLPDGFPPLYLATSRNRQQVYERLGFDRQLYETDFSDDAARLRGYISDSADYRKIIELYEAKPAGEPLFVFNVTMQNHGDMGRLTIRHLRNVSASPAHMRGSTRRWINTCRWCGTAMKRSSSWSHIFHRWTSRRPSSFWGPPAECDQRLLRRSVRQYGGCSHTRGKAGQADHAVLHLGEL